jgi:hypothetical protein
MSYSHVPPELDRRPGEAFIEDSTLRSQTALREQSPGIWTWDEVRCIGDVCRTVTRCHVDMPIMPGMPYSPDHPRGGVFGVPFPLVSDEAGYRGT